MEKIYKDIERVLISKEQIAKRVKESLADFFGMLYSLHRAGLKDKKYAYSRYESWERCYGTDWPYAYARCYYYNNDLECPVFYSDDVHEYKYNGCKELFNKVLKISAQSMPNAYKVLTDKAPEPK